MTQEFDNSLYLKDELYEKVKSDSEIFEFLQNGSLDGIWYWDIEKPENEWLSPRFKEIFGYADDEIPNTSQWWQENIDPEHLNVAIDNFNKHCEDSKHPYDQIVRYNHKDGSSVWVRCRGLAIRDENGKPIRMLGAHTDVTKLISSQNELIETMKTIQVLNSKMREFISIVFHDLRSPIGCIKSYIDVIEDNPSPENISTVLPIIQELTEHSMEMVNQLLDITAIESGKIKLNLEKTNLDILIKKVVQQSRILADKKGIELIDNVKDNIVIDVDNFRITQALINLISNAIKFTPKGGNISIESKVINNQVEISIADNGIGIPKSIINDVFDRSKHVSRRGTNNEKGTGYGLPLVYEIISAHNSNIQVSSIEGEGSTFSFILPVI